MNNTLARISIAFSKIQKQHIQFFLLLVALAMLVIGAGAPTDGLPGIK